MRRAPRYLSDLAGAHDNLRAWRPNRRQRPHWPLGRYSPHPSPALRPPSTQRVQRAISSLMNVLPNRPRPASGAGGSCPLREAFLGGDIGPSQGAPRTSAIDLVDDLPLGCRGGPAIHPAPSPAMRKLGYPDSADRGQFAQQGGALGRSSPAEPRAKPCRPGSAAWANGRHRDDICHMAADRCPSCGVHVTKRHVYHLDALPRLG